MSALHHVLSAPVYDPNTDLWYRTLIYVDENDVQTGETIYLSAVNVSSLPDNDISGAMTFTGLGAAAVTGILFGLTIGGGHPLAGAVGGLASLASELSTSIRAEFFDNIADGLTVLIDESAYNDPNVDLIRVDGNTYTYVLPADDLFNSYYQLKLGGGSLDQIVIDVDSYVLGDAGNDTIFAENGSNTINGGADTDTITYKFAASGVDVDMAAGNTIYLSGGPIKDIFVGIENITGSDYADSILGNLEGNRLAGVEGDDTLEGGGGDDLLVGGAGTDTYEIAAADLGDITIEDSDGVLTIGGTVVGSGFGLTYDGTLDSGLAVEYPDVDGLYTLGNYVLGMFGNDLVMQGDDQSITLKDFQDGDYGIRLGTSHLTSNAVPDVNWLYQDPDYYWTYWERFGSGVVDAYESEAPGEGWSQLVQLTRAISSTESAYIVRAEDITGTSGNDTVNTKGYAASAAYTISTGAGHDIIVSNADVYMAQTVYAGADRDFISIWGGLGNVYGESGDDHIEIVGGSGLTNIYGGSGRDLFLQAGAALVDGGSGIDTWDIMHWDVNSFDASSGSVTIAATNHTVSFSGIENFRLIGTVNANLLQFSSGNDVALSFEGNDTVWGGIGNDFIDGGIDNDSLIGENGADTLKGGSGLDSLYGGNNADSIEGDGGDDYVEGGDGDDFIVGGTGSDFIDGGAGVDTVSYSGSGAWVNVDLANNNHWNGDAAWDNIANVENVIGSNYGDNLVGTNGANMLVGGSGNDSLYGLDSSDTIFGGIGNDYIEAGDADDLIVGGSGSDYIDGGNGADTVSYADSGVWVNIDLGGNNHWNGDAAWDNIVNVENIVGSNFGDQLTGNSAANIIIGGAGNDVLAGGAANDTFYFGAGHGQDVISDFQGVGAASGDIIQVAGGSFGALSFAQNGSDAVITTTTGTITLIGVSAASITVDDFSFAA